MDSSIVLGLEKENSGTSPTGHKEFDRDGYLVIEDIYDPDELYRSVPEPRQQGGSIRYDEDGDIQSTRDEVQVPGSVASYNYPQYKKVHSILREKIGNQKFYLNLNCLIRKNQLCLIAPIFLAHCSVI